jgi:DNA invertase Pin-like site-specific DNA recombinase
VDALVGAGVAQRDVHVDVASGAKASRPELDLVLQLVREGDTLVITRLDRLGRSLVHLVTLGARLRDCGVGLRVLEQGIDSSTAEGRAMYGMLSVLAELQRELIVANTRDGLASARARGRVGGRKPKLTPEQAVPRYGQACGSPGLYQRSWRPPATVTTPPRSWSTRALSHAVAGGLQPLTGADQ